MHKKCSHLSKEIQNHPFHSNHTLSLICLKKYLKTFSCSWCHRVIVDGIRFSCEGCSFRLVVCCASSCLPNTIKHESHDHPLLQTQATTSFKRAGCGDEFKSCLKYGCDTCGFNLDSYCTMLPKTMPHDWDRNPVSLTYPPFLTIQLTFSANFVRTQPLALSLTYVTNHFTPNVYVLLIGGRISSLGTLIRLRITRTSSHLCGRVRTSCAHPLTVVIQYPEDPPPPILECTCKFEVCMLCAHNGDTRSTRMEVTSP